jgi:hypothetical protein
LEIVLLVLAWSRLDDDAGAELVRAWLSSKVAKCPYCLETQFAYLSQKSGHFRVFEHSQESGGG